MSLTVSEIRKNCSSARLAMERARKEHFAFGAFNMDNQETLRAVIQASVKKNAPVLIEVSQGEVDAMGLENIRDMVTNYKKQFNVEVYLNLDHSPSVEAAKAGIDAGFEFIHIDVSQAQHEATEDQIIEETKKVVEYAKFTGALVESEPHYFGGSSNLHAEVIDYEEIKKTFSTPEGAQQFVQASGIDTFAAAIGNLHGQYPVPKQLDLELLKQIRESINCNISLHGGSGTPGHFFIDAVKIGVTKININSDMRVAFRNTLEQVLRDNPNEYAVIKLMDKVIESVQVVVEEKIDMFNSAGKANTLSS